MGTMKTVLRSLEETKEFASSIGRRLKGGEVIELTGDVGSGKTTFTKGLAEGLGVEDDVQSPSFTISRFYKGRDGIELHHYDFYRLPDPGIMRYDLAESTGDTKAVTVVEWAETVAEVLPAKHTIIRFDYDNDESTRALQIEYPTTEIEEAYAKSGRLTVSWRTGFSGK